MSGFLFTEKRPGKFDVNIEDEETEKEAEENQVKFSFSLSHFFKAEKIYACF
jgi:hypothetical protein